MDLISLLVLVFFLAFCWYIVDALGTPQPFNYVAKGFIVLILLVVVAKALGFANLQIPRFN